MESIKINLVPSDFSMPVCHATQYDDGREIMLELFDEKTPYILSDETIELDVKKLDGNVVTTELDVVPGERSVIMKTTEQMCAVAGRNLCTLKVQKDDATIYTKNFYLSVQDNATEGGVESESEINNLETQIAGLVEDAVENQYDSENVIFDSEPTEGHGTGYTVTSAGIKAAIDAAGGNVIDDTTSAADKTYSSNKINTLLDGKANKALIAEEYNATQTYNEGDYCIHSNLLYVCNTDIDTAEAWNASHWTLTDVGTALGDKADVSAIPTKTSQLQNDSSFAQIDDTQASESKVYSSEKVDDLLADKADKSELTNVYGIATGVNLIDDSKFTTGAVQSNGTISTAGAWADYKTTELIPLKPNTDYTLSTWYQKSLLTNTRIVYLLYNDVDSPDKTTYFNNSSINHASFNSGNYKYIMASTSSYYDFMLSVGGVPEEFLDYTSRYELSCYLGDNSVRQVNGLIGGNEMMKLVKEGSLITVDSTVGSKKLTRTYRLTRDTSNHLFNFAYAYINKNSIKNCSDDITPIRIKVNGNAQTTIGANHGWEFSYRCEKGNLDVVDIGSIWTDGTTQYMLLSVSDGYAYFMPPVTKSEGVIYCSAIEPVSDLVHVSGATHTDSIPKASLTNYQLYPSINKRTVSLKVDGEDITSKDGEYYVGKAVVEEKYGIMDLYDLYVYAGNNVGAVDYDEVDTICEMSIVYEITASTEVVYTNITAKESVALANCGFIQSQGLSGYGGTIYRYVNGVDNGVFDSDALVDMTNYNTTNVITSENIKADQIPNRCVEVCKDNNNKIVYGFALGYIPDIGDGSDVKRGENTSFWDMRNTKKIYPICVQSGTKTLSVGEQLNVVAYRAYFGDIVGATGKFTVKIGDKVYSVFDTHSTASGSIEGGKLGNKVETVNNDGATVSDFVNANGISYYSSNSYSAFVVKS